MQLLFQQKSVVMSASRPKISLKLFVPTQEALTTRQQLQHMQIEQLLIFVNIFFTSIVAKSFSS